MSTLLFSSCFLHFKYYLPASLFVGIFFKTRVAQWSRIRLPMQETWVQSLGQEDPLE